MRPCLETLERRDMLDAALAANFATYVAPSIQKEFHALNTAMVGIINEGLSQAISAAEVLGPAFAAENLPPLVQASAAVLEQIPQLEDSLAAALIGITAELYQLPSGSVLSPYP